MADRTTNFGRGISGSIINTGAGELNGLASFKSLSSAFEGVIEGARRLSKQLEVAGEIRSGHIDRTRQINYGRLVTGISGMQGALGGSIGQNVDQLFQKFLSKVRSLGGIKISATDLKRELGDLASKIEHSSSGATGIDKRLVDKFLAGIRKAEEQSKDGGVLGIGGVGNQLIKASGFAKSNKIIDEGISNISKTIEQTSDSLSDQALKNALKDIREEMENAANAAGTTAEKLNILKEAADKVEALVGVSRGSDRTSTEDLSRRASQTANETLKAVKEQNSARFGARIGQAIEKGMSVVGTAFRMATPLMRSLAVANAGFQFVNTRLNRFAQMQMRISAERGAFGRMIRGSGTGFGNVISAVAAGRRAGMDDSSVVNQVVNLQEQLARARWGEGSLIDSAGKWGISVYDESGRVKSHHQMMIEFSNLLNSMSDEQEKLQFLSMQGFRPEQKEYVENYAREAKRWDEIKRNPRLQGTLESARIFDESGLYAKADAATKIELKRRQILNQNAIDEGVIAGLKRKIHPENWLFGDWTARQKGLSAARSEIAQDKLTKALNGVKASIDNNGLVVTNNTRALSSLSIDELASLSLTGGAAQASIANLGAKSQYYELRKAFANKYGLRNQTEVEEEDKFYSSAIGGEAGALGGALALLALGTGPVGWITAAGLTGIGALLGYNFPFINPDDGSQKIIDELRRANTSKELDAVMKKYNISGLSLAQVKSEEFQKDDKKARQAFQGAWLYQTNVMANALLKSGQRINPNDSKWNDDQFLVARKQLLESLGMELSQMDVARAKARQVDKNLVSTQEAFELVTNIDKQPFTEEEEVDLARETNRFAEEYGMDYEAAREEARKSVIEKRKKRTLTPDIVEKARQYKGTVSEEEKQKAEEVISRASSFWNPNISQREYADKSPEEIGDRIKEVEEELKKPSPEYEKEIRRGIIKDLTALKNAKEVINRYNNENKVQENIDKVIGTGEQTPIGLLKKEDRAKAFEERIFKKVYGAGQDVDEGEVKAELDRRGVIEDSVELAKKELAQDSQYNKASEEKKNELVQKRAQKIRRKEVEKVREELSYKKAMENGPSESLEMTWARIKAEAKKHGTTGEDVLSHAMTEEEANEIEEKLSRGEEVAAEEKRKYDLWSKYSRAGKNLKKRKDEEERKRQKKEEENSIEEEYRKRFLSSEVGGEGKEVELSESGGEGSGEVASSEKISEKASEVGGEGKEVELSDRHIKLMRMARARNKNVDLTKGGFSTEEVAAFDKQEEERKQRFLDRMIGTAEDYVLFREKEDKMLRGEELESDDLAEVEKTQRKIEASGGRTSGRRAIRRSSQRRGSELRREKRSYSEATLNRLRENDIRMKEWERRKKERSSGLQSVQEGGDTGNGLLGGIQEQTNVISSLLDKEKSVQQMSELAEEKVRAGQVAAASAKEINSSSMMGGEKSVTINFGGQTITQNIKGEYPMDREGMKRGTLEGSTEIKDTVAEAFVSVMKCKNQF